MNWPIIRALAGAVGGSLLIVGLAYAFLVTEPLVGRAVAGETVCGKASWYGAAHQGRKMANGKPFNRFALTAAMWDVPLGSVYSVRNVQNGRIVQVTITDRGPARRLHRIIDLSEAAATVLGFRDAGVAKVCAERVGR